jgi:hypothetical protein
MISAATKSALDELKNSLPADADEYAMVLFTHLCNYLDSEPTSYSLDGDRVVISGELNLDKQLEVIFNSVRDDIKALITTEVNEIFRRAKDLTK